MIPLDKSHPLFSPVDPHRDTVEETPTVPLPLLLQLERDCLIPPDRGASEGTVHEYIGQVRLVRRLRNLYNEQNNPDEE